MNIIRPCQRRIRTRLRALRRDRERGSITPFVVVFALGFVILAGFIYDGGRALAAKTSAINEAQQAARTAAQALNPAELRNNVLATTPGQAIADAEAYIASCGDTGTATVNGDQITVTVTHRQSTEILGVIGISEITVTGNATAKVEQGVTTSAQQGP